MKKATIIFGSTTGNTEIVADKIAETMTGYDVQVIYVTDAKDDTAVKEADLVLYGCSTMGLGELQDDFIPYYENRMTPPCSRGRTWPCLVWGTRKTMRITSAGRRYPQQEGHRVRANLVCPPLKVDGEPDDNEAAVVAWAQAL